jgi:hypothetical protein
MGYDGFYDTVLLLGLLWLSYVPLVPTWCASDHCRHDPESVSTVSCVISSVSSFHLLLPLPVCTKKCALESPHAHNVVRGLVGDGARSGSVFHASSVCNRAPQPANTACPAAFFL